MERIISATQARIHFGELMRQVVENKEPVIVERGGKPQVVVLSVAEYNQLKTGGQRDRDVLERAARLRAQITEQLGERTLPPAQEIIRDMREDRGEQLTGLR